VRALNDVSLTIGPGMLGLLGPNARAEAQADRAVPRRGPSRAAMTSATQAIQAVQAILIATTAATTVAITTTTR
jgi:hypothetical protein